MRTTLSIDDDVLAAVRERARRSGHSIGHVLSELARRALQGSAAPPEDDGLHGFVPFPHRGAIVTNDLIDGLRDDQGL